jgi:hypothetical protein
MSDLLANFLRDKKIDSYQKVRLLLYLYQHPGIRQTMQELAQKLYLGGMYMLADTMTELQGTGLIDCEGDYYTLCNDPAVNAMLQRLSKTFEDPVARQRILQQVKQGPQSERIPMEYPALILSERFMNAF